MYSAQPMLRGGRSGSEKNEYAQQQPVAAHATPSAVQPVQSPSGQYPVFPQQVPYGYPAMYGYASVPVPTNAPVSASATLPVNQIPAFQSMQSGYYQMAPAAQHISQQQQQQQQFYPINDYGTQFYQFAQPQPDSASVPLYSHNQVPFYSHPPAFFSQPAAPAPTPIPVQPQFCSGTPSSENALHHNQQQQQQPFVVPVQQIGHYTNQPPYKPAGVPLHASTPLNGSEWGQSEKEFEQKSTASSVQPGSGQSAQGAMRNVASGSCISAIYASDDDLFGSGQSMQPQMQLQTLSLNQALQQPPQQPFQTLHTQANHHLPPPGFDYTQQGYRYSLPGSTLPIQSPSSGSNLHNQTANSCDATVISTQQPLPAQQSTLTTLNYSGPRANIHRPNPNFSLHRRSDLFRNRGIVMNGMERRMEGMRLDDRAGGNGPSEQGRADDMARNEWKGRLANGNANANGQEGFRQFNGNRNPFRQVTSRVQSAGFRTDVCYKFRDNAFCPNGDACRFLHLDAHGNPTNVNQNWGQTTKGSGDSGLSSEDNSNPSGWRQGGQTDRHGQAERNGRNGPSAGRGNNHNNRPWLPQAQGQYRPFNNRQQQQQQQQQQQAQPQAQGNQPSRQSNGEGRAAQGRPDVVGGRGGGLERNQGPSQAQRGGGGYRPNTRYGAPPIQNIQNGNQNEDRPQLQRQAVNH